MDKEKPRECDYCEHKGKTCFNQLRWWCVPLSVYVEENKPRPTNCPRLKETRGNCWAVTAK